MEFSVLITVYGADNPKFFKEAMNSIWFTQSLQPSQIVLVQDGPVCREVSSIITCYKKILGEKLTFFELKINAGLAFALNEGFKLVKYSLIARMDSDDISLPDRFQKQIDYITKNDVDIVGGQILEFGKDINDVFSKRLVPLDHDDIVSFMKFRSPFSHPTIMFKKQVVEDLQGYSTTLFPEDYEFFVRAYLKGYKFANLSDNLLYFRIGENRAQSLKRRRGIKYAKNELRLLWQFYKLGFHKKSTFIQACLMRLPIRLLPLSLVKFIYFKILR
jgi:glycosyltransferase involved in cell wall biosynthesis